MLAKSLLVELVLQHLGEAAGADPIDQSRSELAAKLRAQSNLHEV